MDSLTSYSELKGYKVDNILTSHTRSSPKLQKKLILRTECTLLSGGSGVYIVFENNAIKYEGLNLVDACRVYNTIK